MRWIDLVKRDPVPWLLDPENPSARLLTLRNIFNRPAAALASEREALFIWAPIQALIRQATPPGFWGRERNPYFGGPIGTFGTLSTLAQVGVPTFPEAQVACKSLLEEGRLQNGRFAPQTGGPLTWLCYTGMALHLLQHFGFGDDPRTRMASTVLAYTVLHDPQSMICKIAGGPCLGGNIKALIGLLSTPAEQRTAEELGAIQSLTEQLLAYPFELSGRDAGWLQVHFPRYYESDLIELCHVLAELVPLDHPSYQKLLKALISMQTEEGRWIKTSPSPTGIQVERPGQPSRWLTFEAIHTLIGLYGGNAYAT